MSARDATLSAVARKLFRRVWSFNQSTERKENRMSVRIDDAGVERLESWALGAGLENVKEYCAHRDPAVLQAARISASAIHGAARYRAVQASLLKLGNAATEEAL
jgi:hypothetical protein